MANVRGHAREVMARQRRARALERDQAAAPDSISSARSSTTSELPGHTIDRCVGVLSVTVARANGALRDIATAWRDDFGGRMGAFGELADAARREALLELRKAAFAEGADAVVGVQISVTAPTTSVLVVTATGTGVTLVPEPQGAEPLASAAAASKGPDDHGTAEVGAPRRTFECEHCGAEGWTTDGSATDAVCAECSKSTAISRSAEA